MHDEAARPQGAEQSGLDVREVERGAGDRVVWVGSPRHRIRQCPDAWDRRTHELRDIAG